MIVDSPELDSLEQDRVVHMQAVVHVQPREELLDRSETSVEKEALPLLAVQTCHLSCPSQSCVGSANHPKS